MVVSAKGVIHHLLMNFTKTAQESTPLVTSDLVHVVPVCMSRDAMAIKPGGLIAELLCGRRPQKWSPIPILRGMLVIFYGHGKRNGSRARAPYIHTYIHTYVRTSHFMTFLHEAIFPGRAETKEKRRR